MLRAVARLTTAAAGAAVALALVAVPASADGVVPDGCAGSVVYACTGAATPPGYAWWSGRVVGSLPVALHVQNVTVQGTTVGGQKIGGVVVVAGGQTTPVVSATLGGPTQPVFTGLYAPVNACLFVTCYVAGDPIVIPGVSLPVVPVVVGSQTLPTYSVPVPEVATVPTESTPTVTLVPTVDQTVATLTVYYAREEVWVAAYDLCYSGGGHYDYDVVVGHYACVGGVYAPVANALFLVYWYA